ncbi:hypothetical protein MRX96_012790 [Rhipicephalus microplus]
MRSRTIVSLFLLGIFVLSIVAAVAILFGPTLWFASSAAKCDTAAKMKLPSPHTDAMGVAPKDEGAANPVSSPFRHMALPDVVTDTGVTLAQPRHVAKPTRFHVVLLMLGLLVLWVLRTTGLLLPGLAAVAALGALMVPLGQRQTSTETGGGPSCGLSAICRFTETARNNVHLRMELAGLPAPYVKHVGRIFALLENVNCDRIEQTCSRVSFSDFLPF